MKMINIGSVVWFKKLPTQDLKYEGILVARDSFDRNFASVFEPNSKRIYDVHKSDMRLSDSTLTFKNS